MGYWSSAETCVDYSEFTSAELFGAYEGWQWRRAEYEQVDDQNAIDYCDLVLAAVGREINRRKRIANGPALVNGSSRWSRERFQRCKDAVRLEDYAQTYCLLQRAEWRGTTKLWACCPLPMHREVTPSFRIDTATQRWRCFGCHEFGDVIDLCRFIENLYQVTDAVERLESLYGIAEWQVQAREHSRPFYTVQMADGSTATINVPLKADARHRRRSA